MKKTLVLTFLLLVGIVSSLIAENPIIPPKPGDQGIALASVCSSASSNLSQSQKNMLAWLSGIDVPTDPKSDPTARNGLVGDSLQWWHFVATSFHSWRGTTVLTNPAVGNEYGHRIVVNVFGLIDLETPVGSYTCQISSTVTNIGSPPAFSVATNSANQEIPCNPNYIIVDFGPNGQYESHYDRSQGNMVQGGDDRVFQNGELPSTLTIAHGCFWRLGATVVVTLTSPSQFGSIMDQFVKGVPSITARLFKNGGLVDEKIIRAAQSRLVIDRDNSLLTITSGQLGIPYRVQTATNISNPTWTAFFSPDPPFNSEQPIVIPINQAEPSRFFRLLTGF